MFPGRGNYPSGRIDLSWTIKGSVSSYFRLFCLVILAQCLSAVYILGEDPVLRELELLLVL